MATVKAYLLTKDGVKHWEKTYIENPTRLTIQWWMFLANIFDITHFTHCEVIFEVVKDHWHD